MDRNEPTPEVVKTLLEAHHHAILGRPIIESLARGLPFRSITDIEDLGGRTAGVTITEIRSGKVHDAREMYALAALMLAWLSVFKPVYVNTVKDENELHYLYVLDRLSFPRVMVGARAGENIRLGSAHKLLLPENFKVVLTEQVTTDARPWAIAQALAEWDKNAERLGLSLILPRDRYEQILREIFALFDREYGHLLKRPVKEAAE